MQLGWGEVAIVHSTLMFDAIHGKFAANMELQSITVLWWTLLSTNSKRDCKSTWWIYQKPKKKGQKQSECHHSLSWHLVVFSLLGWFDCQQKNTGFQWGDSEGLNALVLLEVFGKKSKHSSIPQGPSNLLTTSFKVNQIMEGSSHYSGSCKPIWAVKTKNNPLERKRCLLCPLNSLLYGMLTTIPISPPHKEVRY